jgi:hypothetical protein
MFKSADLCAFIRFGVKVTRSRLSQTKSGTVWLRRGEDLGTQLK